MKLFLNTVLKKQFFQNYFENIPNRPPRIFKKNPYFLISILHSDDIIRYKYFFFFFFYRLHYKDQNTSTRPASKAKTLPINTDNKKVIFPFITLPIKQRQKFNPWPQLAICLHCDQRWSIQKEKVSHKSQLQPNNNNVNSRVFDPT